MMGKLSAASAVLCAAVLAGCVSQGTHNEALGKIKGLDQEKAGLLAKVREMESRVSTLERDAQVKTQEIAALRQEAATLKQEAQSARGAAENMRIAKDKDLDEMRFKLKDIQTRTEVLLDRIKTAQQH